MKEARKRSVSLQSKLATQDEYRTTYVRKSLQRPTSSAQYTDPGPRRYIRKGKSRNIHSAPQVYRGLKKPRHLGSRFSNFSDYVKSRRPRTAGEMSSFAETVQMTKSSLRHAYKEVLDQWDLPEEKPKFAVSAVKGTIYEDYRGPINLDNFNKKLLDPLWNQEMEKLYSIAKSEEIERFCRRIKILAKFRLKRLDNILKEKALGSRRNPVIWTPQMWTPFNPNADDTRKLTRTTQRLENLAKPRLRLNIPLPAKINMDSGNVQNILREIKNLRRVRERFHWTHSIQPQEDTTEFKQVEQADTASHHSDRADSQKTLSHDGKLTLDLEPRTFDTIIYQPTNLREQRKNMELAEELDRFEQNLQLIQAKQAAFLSSSPSRYGR